MAVVTRTTVAPSAVAPKVFAKLGGTPKFKLPTAPDDPIYDLNQHHMLITGEPGIGKTTLGLAEPDVYNLTFDPMRKSLKGKLQTQFSDWATFQQAIAALRDAAKTPDTFPYSRVQCDGVDIMYQRCIDWVCADMGIKTLSDGDYGAGWARAKQAFSVAVDDLMGLPCGVWFTCHSREREVVKRDGRKVERLSPLLSKQADEIIVGRVDIVLNMVYIGNDRVATVRGDETVTAKCCVDERFLTTKGRRVLEVVLGNDGPTEAYKRLIDAYENRQTYATYNEWVAQRSATPTAAVKK